MKKINFEKVAAVLLTILVAVFMLYCFRLVTQEYELNELKKEQLELTIKKLSNGIEKR